MRRIFVKPPVQWMPGLVWRTLVRVALGLSLGLLAGLARMALSAQLQATVPYVLVFAFVTLSTVLGGWLSGIVTLALAQVVTWYFVLLPQSSFALDNPLAGAGLVAATASAAFVVATIAIYQREVARAHHARELVVRELNHRVKNTLSVVQSLARSTFGDESRSQVRAYSGRLRALAAAHDVLTKQEWTSADLGEVMQRALAPFRNDLNDQFEVNGVHFPLPPRASINFALAIHELATNAVKYGALSVPSGRVLINWSVQPDHSFEFTWQEVGGPPVVEPTRRGFGTNLIGRGVAREIGASVHLDFRPEGLVCRFSGRVEASS